MQQSQKIYHDEPKDDKSPQKKKYKKMKLSDREETCNWTQTPVRIRECC